MTVDSGMRHDKMGEIFIAFNDALHNGLRLRQYCHNEETLIS
jgi:hypothetical protein